MPDPRHRLGEAAEEATAAWLTRSGWRVLARRWRSHGRGELDLVCLDARRVLVGIEVRARRSARAGSAPESLDRRRLARLRAALAAYATEAPPHRGLRLDLVTVEPEPAHGAWRLRRFEAIAGW